MDPVWIPSRRHLASRAASCALVARRAPAMAAVLGAVLLVLLAPTHVVAAEPSPEPVRLPPFERLAVGSQHSCVLVEGGEVWCWGYATDGALGAGPGITSTELPVRAALPRPAIALDAGFEGTCAITDDGTAWCWGRNESGEVGDGTTENRFEPTQVTGLARPAVGISRGHDHACAVLDDGSGWCWGDNTVNELGIGRQPGSAANEPVPIRVAGVPGLVAVSAGGGFTCALSDVGGAWCWGSDLFGELGRAGDYDWTVPGPVAGLDSGVDAIDAGDDQACAIRDGALLCWGLMDEAQAATDPEAASWPTPRLVEVGAPVVEVSLANGYHRCARDEKGGTWCWGNAEVGQLGPSVGEDVEWVLEPVRQEVPAAFDLETGYDVTCGLFGADDLRCWGDGDPVARNPWTGETGPSADGFREPGPLVPTLTTYIPTPRDVSTDPPVVGANLFFAALVMLLFTIAGELLNRTLAENEDALAGRGGALAAMRRGRARFDAALLGRLGRGRRMAAVQLAGIAAIYGLVFSLLDQTWDPFSVTGVWLFASMAIAFGVVGIADDLACWSAARRWGVASDLDLRPGNLVVAVASTLASRVAVLVPGVMLGMPEALEVDVDALGERRRARLAGIGLGTLVIIGSGAWAVTLGTSVLGDELEEGAATLVNGVEAFFLVVFAVTVQNGFAQMLAFRGTPGRILRASHRWLWLVGLLGATFLFWHTLVNPRGDLATALGETNVVAFVATAVGFVLAATVAWLWFAVQRRRTRRGDAAPPIDAAEPVIAHPGAPAAEPPPAAASVAAASVAADAPLPAALPVAALPTSAPAALPTSGPAALPTSAPAVALVPAPPTVVLPTAAGAHPVLEFELTAIGNRRLRGRVRVRVRPDGVGIAGTWISVRADRLERIAGAAATILLVVGLLGIALLTTVPGFRFYRVPWLIPSAVVAAIVLAVAVLLVRLWRSRQRWSGEVASPAALLVGVRRSFNVSHLVATCIFLTPIGGALYAALVGRTVVRLRGPFDPERTAVVEVRLRCRDRDEASDVAARVAAIRGAPGAPTGPGALDAPTGGWQ